MGHYFLDTQYFSSHFSRTIDYWSGIDVKDVTTGGPLGGHVCLQGFKLDLRVYISDNL